MTEIRDLLERSIADRHRPAVDPAADLARGHRSLHRRRATVVGGFSAAAVAAVATPLALHGTTPVAPVAAAGTGPSAPVRPSTTSPSATARSLGVRLVSYEGEQPDGYHVTWMPAGWEIQGRSTEHLTIAPVGFANQDPSYFVGKIVVLSQSVDAADGTRSGGASQPVEGRPGRLSVADDVQVLDYMGDATHEVVIQAPTSLQWSAADMARFAAGVEVLPAVTAGHG